MVGSQSLSAPLPVNLAAEHESRAEPGEEGCGPGGRLRGRCMRDPEAPTCHTRIPSPQNLRYWERGFGPHLVVLRSCS